MFKCKITLIAGVVSAIDLYESIQSLLGDRFLKIRTEVGNVEKVSEYAKKLCGREEEVRKKLHELTMRFLENLKVDRMELDEKTDSYLIELASFIARARTSVVRDWYGVIQYMPQSEGIARVYKQLLKLSWAFAAVLGKSEIDDTILRLLTRIAVDTIDRRRILILQALTAHRTKKTSVVAMEVGMPTETVRKILEDLTLIGFVAKSGDEDKGYEWSLNEEISILSKYEKNIRLLPEILVKKEGEID